MLALRIERDRDAESPWEWSSDATERFYTNVPGYLRSQNTKDEMSDFTQGAKNLAGIMQRIRTTLPGPGWCLYPVNAYIHSGIVLSLGRGYPFNDCFDSGLAGILAINPIAMGHKKGRANLMARKCAEETIETWNQFLAGEVYGYIIEDDENPEIHESLWGMYGYDHCETEGRAALEALEKQVAAHDRECLQVMAL